MKYKVSLILILLLTSIQSASGQIKMNANQFDSLLSKNKSIQLIDVRTPGEVSSGYDVVQAIENTSVGAGDKPVEDQKIIKAYVKK